MLRQMFRVVRLSNSGGACAVARVAACRKMDRGWKVGRGWSSGWVGVAVAVLMALVSAREARASDAVAAGMLVIGGGINFVASTVALGLNADALAKRERPSLDRPVMGIVTGTFNLVVGSVFIDNGRDKFLGCAVDVCSFQRESPASLAIGSIAIIVGAVTMAVSIAALTIPEGGEKGGGGKGSGRAKLPKKPKTTFQVVPTGAMFAQRGEVSTGLGLQVTGF